MTTKIPAETAPRIRRLRHAQPRRADLHHDSSAHTEIKGVSDLDRVATVRQLRAYGEPNTRVSSIRPRLLGWPSCPRPSSALYHLQPSVSPPADLHRLTHRTGRPGARADRTSFTTSCRGQFWSSQNHADISGSGGGAVQKLVQFARTSAFCKNSCAQRPRLTPRSRTRPRQPQGTADHKPGSWPERVPGTRRRVRHGGRPGARRAGGARQVHRADPGRGLVAARRADGTRLRRPGCATAVGLRVPIGPVPYRRATPARHPRYGHPAYRLRPSRTSATQARATWKSLSLVPATTVTGRASRRG